MSRQLFLQLAEASARLPIGTDLVLRQHPDHAAILLDGDQLGAVYAEAASRFRTQLAFPLMDLQLEKAALLGHFGIPADRVATYHFEQSPAPEKIAEVKSKLAEGVLPPRMRANAGAIAHIASKTDLYPVGMSIGPFSLMTKLIADPITPVYMAAGGTGAEDDDEVRLVETCLDLGMATILASLRNQIRAGAKAIFIAEPAANKVYLSPNQIEAGSDIFDRYVTRWNRRIVDLLESEGVDLIFHCCGELIDPMLAAFASLHPAVISLGSSRRLWEDAALVPKDIVLYGNLPSKQFYSDTMLGRDDVMRMARDLMARMKSAGHPFILGTECDTLAVEGREATIMDKVQAILDA